MSTYRSRAQDAAEDLPPQVLRACGYCGAPTPHDTLATLGARCHACYLAFCRQVQPKERCGDRRQGLKDWAYALKLREESGERLSIVQRSMWRAALRHEESAA